MNKPTLSTDIYDFSVYEIEEIVYSCVLINNLQQNASDFINIEISKVEKIKNKINVTVSGILEYSVFSKTETQPIKAEISIDKNGNSNLVECEHLKNVSL